MRAVHRNERRRQLTEVSLAVVLPVELVADADAESWKIVSAHSLQKMKGKGDVQRGRSYQQQRPGWQLPGLRAGVSALRGRQSRDTRCSPWAPRRKRARMAVKARIVL